jgi:hypothetical protein
MAVSEWLRLQELYLHRDGIFKFMSRWNKRIEVFVDFVEKQ